MKLIIRIIINAIAVWITALLIPGITLVGSIWSLLLVAIIFGLVNALVRPIVKLLIILIGHQCLDADVNQLDLWRSRARGKFSK